MLIRCRRIERQLDLSCWTVIKKQKKQRMDKNWLPDVDLTFTQSIWRLFIFLIIIIIIIKIRLKMACRKFLKKINETMVLLPTIHCFSLDQFHFFLRCCSPLMIFLYHSIFFHFNYNTFMVYTFYTSTYNYGLKILMIEKTNRA